jgi:hypothetical protein
MLRAKALFPQRVASGCKKESCIRNSRIDTCQVTVEVSQENLGCSTYRAGLLKTGEWEFSYREMMLSVSTNSAEASRTGNRSQDEDCNMPPASKRILKTAIAKHHIRAIFINTGFVDVRQNSMVASAPTNGHPNTTPNTYTARAKLCRSEPDPFEEDQLQAPAMVKLTIAIEYAAVAAILYSLLQKN